MKTLDFEDQRKTEIKQIEEEKRHEHLPPGSWEGGGGRGGVRGCNTSIRCYVESPLCLYNQQPLDMLKMIHYVSVATSDSWSRYLIAEGLLES